MEQKEKIKQSIGEGLLLFATLLIMSGLLFADSDKTSIGHYDIIGLCISGAGFLILFSMFIYFAYTSYVSIKKTKPPHEM